MSQLRTSILDVRESITQQNVTQSDFIPNNGNIFPKYPDKLNSNAVEVWLFDAMTVDGQTAFTVSFVRDVLAAPRGFRIQVNATWSDGTIWSNPLVFPVSTVESDDHDLVQGKVIGTWHDEKGDDRAYFEIAADLSSAKVTFEVPGKIMGTLMLRSRGFQCLPRTTNDAQMAPGAYWMRPIAIADAVVDMVFYAPNADGQITEKRMAIDEDQSATGGVDRSWEPMPWAKVMSDSYFLRAVAGPYVIQIMRLVGRAEQNHELYTTARLYRDGELVCAPLRALTVDNNFPAQNQEDVLIFEKLFEGEGVPATFRHKNVGSRFTFRPRHPDGPTWSFEARHRRAWWSKPSSPPGPSSTGHAGFVVSLDGGLCGSEGCHGWGIAGQVDMP